MSATSILDGNVTDQNGLPVAGAQVYIYGQSGELASLADDFGSPASNPIVTGTDGYWKAFVQYRGLYTVRYLWGNRVRYVEANRIAGVEFGSGEFDSAQALEAADNAKNSQIAVANDAAEVALDRQLSEDARDLSVAASQVASDLGNAPLYSALADLPTADGTMGFAIIPYGADEGIYEDTGSWTRQSDTQAVRASLEADRAEAAAASIDISLNDSLKYIGGIADEAGNMVQAVGLDGRVLSNTPVSPLSTGTYDFQVNQVFVYGQSLSVGQARPAISTVQNYGNLMFNSGMIPQYDTPGATDAVNYASLVPARETNSTGNTLLGETPATGFGDGVQQLIRSEDGLSGLDYKFLLSAPGYGGLTITELDKGTTHYSRMITQATYGASLSAGLGATHAVQAITWTQGESDYVSGTTQATYETLLNSLVADSNTDIKAATGQTKDVVWIVDQVGTHLTPGRTTPNIALAQLAVANSNPLVFMSGPKYQYEYQDRTDYHLFSTGSRRLGFQNALVYKRVVIDGEDWSPLQPLSIEQRGAALYITFHVPDGQLVFDTLSIKPIANEGFELVDSGGTPLTISSVDIVAPTVVKVTAASTVPAGAKLRYAWSGADGSGPNMPRGTLRDTQGDRIRFDPDGLNVRADNFCVIFEMGV